MAYPTKRDLNYSYTGFAAGQGDNSFPGAEVDNDLDNLKETIDETVDFIEDAFTSEGVLRISALPTAADFTAEIEAAEVSADDAETAATAAAASASAASTSQTDAATSASAASTSASSASSSASAAAASASSAATTLSTAALKANNLSDLANAGTARTNLGLGTAATTASSAYATAAQGTKADTALQTLPAGSVTQVVNTQTGAVATGTTTLPYDDTIPQNTEGDQYMSLAVTPRSATNKLRIKVVIHLATSGSSSTFIAALFQDSTAGALAAGMQKTEGSNDPHQIIFEHYMTAGTTSSTTFKVRAGLNGAGTTTFNGGGGTRRMGGVLASSITIEEIVV